MIRGTTLSGYGLPGLLAFVLIVAGAQALLTQIWERPEALTIWLILVGGLVGMIFVVEAVNRRNVVEVSGDHIRWSLRQPPDKGDQPISNIRRVEVSPLGASLVFDGHEVVARRVDFRRGDFARLVETLRGMGVQVSP